MEEWGRRRIQNLLEYFWPGEGESKTTIFRGYRRKRKQEKQEERRRSSWVEEVVLLGEGKVRKVQGEIRVNSPQENQSPL